MDYIIRSYFNQKSKDFPSFLETNCINILKNVSTSIVDNKYKTIIIAKYSNHYYVWWLTLDVGCELTYQQLKSYKVSDSIENAEKQFKFIDMSLYQYKSCHLPFFDSLDKYQHNNIPITSIELMNLMNNYTCEEIEHVINRVHDNVKGVYYNNEYFIQCEPNNINKMLEYIQ